MSTRSQEQQLISYALLHPLKVAEERGNKQILVLVSNWKTLEKLQTTFSCFEEHFLGCFPSPSLSQVSIIIKFQDFETNF